ncbi:MAG TPA: response regulator [Burkholderiales bacterium]|nr:response regulator [Burkholderiales bacterium]
MRRPLKRIMLVEDDPDILLIARLSLEIGGYDVQVCASGAGAVQSAASYGPDLILLDVMMPGMDGLATMDALRKLPETAATPMVFFTANTQDDLRQDLLRRGALGVITKPFEPNALVEQVNALWQRFSSGA